MHLYPPLKSVAIPYKIWFGSHNTCNTNHFSRERLEDLCKNTMFGGEFSGGCVGFLGLLFCFVK